MFGIEFMDEIMGAFRKELARQQTAQRRRGHGGDDAILGEWIRAKQALQFFGIPEHRLRQFVIDRKVIAKKFDVNDRGSAVVYKTADIRRAIEELPDYVAREERV